MVYNKLVRDKIPDIIKAGGEIPQIRTLSPEEYSLLLEKKLDEETAEFHAEKNLEELADILEVVYALAENMGASREDLMRCYRQKHETRGGFQKRILLVSKEG